MKIISWVVGAPNRVRHALMLRRIARSRRMIDLKLRILAEDYQVLGDPEMREEMGRLERLRDHLDGVAQTALYSDQDDLYI